MIRRTKKIPELFKTFAVGVAPSQDASGNEGLSVYPGKVYPY